MHSWSDFIIYIARCWWLLFLQVASPYSNNFIVVIKENLLLMIALLRRWETRWNILSAYQNEVPDFIYFLWAIVFEMFHIIYDRSQTVSYFFPMFFLWMKHKNKKKKLHTIIASEWGIGIILSFVVVFIFSISHFFSPTL